MAWTQISIYRFAFDKSPQIRSHYLSIVEGFPFCDGVSTLLATCLKGYNPTLGTLLVEESPPASSLENFYEPHEGCAAAALFDT